eukprot:GEZU01019536.1.p1 GENE.GEZU01019536.1~~GEZU01019536.1.p1  ORF type:complete len:107 (-),score=20.79 GEZU01019536.1:41-361(-)
MRPEVRQLYKELFWIAQDYPGKPVNEVRNAIKRAFIKNRDLCTQEEIEKAIERGQFVLKEIQALISLKKYRTLKNRYYNTEYNNEETPPREDVRETVAGQDERTSD